MKKDHTTSCSIYVSDKEKVEAFKYRKKIPKLADAIRICVECADAHGALK